MKNLVIVILGIILFGVFIWYASNDINNTVKERVGKIKKIFTSPSTKYRGLAMILSMGKLLGDDETAPKLVGRTIETQIKSNGKLYISIAGSDNIIIDKPFKNANYSAEAITTTGKDINTGKKCKITIKGENDKEKFKYFLLSIDIGNKHFQEEVELIGQRENYDFEEEFEFEE